MMTGVLPRVKMVSTGGTICMKVDPNTGGAVPALSGADLATAVPGLGGVARVEVEEFSRVESTAMGPSTWTPLVRRLRAIFDGDPDLAGIVVTHGTGLLDEAAYFVDLALAETRPVVFTGAARNASIWDTDGPRNILGATRVAAASAARDMGVLVCLNDQIHAARDAVKRHANSVEAYMSGDHGLLGNAYYDTVRFYRKPLRRPHFSLEKLDPRVEIVMMYSESDGRFVKTCIDTGVSGIVIQGVNTGNVNAALHNAILQALKAGIAVVLTTNLPYGQVYPIYGSLGGGKSLRDAGAIMAEDLKPRKARLLLMFALGETRDRKRLQEIFLNA
ncbi:MAG: asparaginase [Betaproteobacteria bacterium]|nr:asparaginase [Betaproteobacteria bacterium]